jgi:hypothetical protein
MKFRWQSVLAWTVFAVTVVGAMANQVLQHDIDPLSPPFVAMSLVGAVIVSRTGGR